MDLLSGNSFWIVNLPNAYGYMSKRYGVFIIDKIPVICPLFKIVESSSFNSRDIWSGGYRSVSLTETVILRPKTLMGLLSLWKMMQDTWELSRISNRDD